MEVRPQATTYRYSERVRRQALLWLALSLAALVALIAVLVLRWGELPLLARSLGLVLALSLIFTARAQWTRRAFQLRLLADRIELAGPLGARAIPWEQIVEVRRMRLPQVGRSQRWACALLTQGRTGNVIPNYAFDDQLERANDALADVVRATPHARHTNIGTAA
jgi:hypothetical protein